ncbi:MAG: hypothetical protein ACREOC_05210 [Gemmatimonadales bacterium]
MEQPKPSGSSGPGVGRSDRPLGRGLEDVSHVFLSQQAGGGSIDPAGRPAGRPLPREASASSAVLLRPAAHVTREQVAAALKEFEGALEEGLREIGAEIPCAPCGEIDLLAIDRANQLAIIDFDTTSSDELLIRGLGHVDWVVRNVSNVRRMFRGQAINFSLQPRLFLLAPRFSSSVRCAARQITHLQIAWVRYHFVETPGRAGIFFEPLSEE